MQANLTLDGVLRLDRCPGCRTALPHLTLQHIIQTPLPGDYALRVIWAIYRCESCADVVAAKSLSDKHQVLQSDGNFVTGELVKLRVEEVIPSLQEYSESIPERPREFLTQARDCLHAPAGSVMLSASAVDAMLKEHKLVQGRLHARINEAVKQHLITEDMGRWAHQIRLDANDQRHADMDAPLPSQKDAELCLDFAVALADLLFVLPARVTRGLSKANASQSQTATAEG